MRMMIRFECGPTVEAVLLDAKDKKIRVAVESRKDTLELVAGRMKMGNQSKSRL